MDFNRLINTVIDTKAYRGTLYLDSSTVAKVTRRLRVDARARREEFVITLGTPNYLERKFIKIAKKAGESFPIRKVQLKFKKVA